jgi:hypothetical protein
MVAPTPTFSGFTQFFPAKASIARTFPAGDCHNRMWQLAQKKRKPFQLPRIIA